MKIAASTASSMCPKPVLEKFAIRFAGPAGKPRLVATRFAGPAGKPRRARSATRCASRALRPARVATRSTILAGKITARKFATRSASRAGKRKPATTRFASRAGKPSPVKSATRSASRAGKNGLVATPSASRAGKIVRVATRTTYPKRCTTQRRSRFHADIGKPKSIVFPVRSTPGASVSPAAGRTILALAAATIARARAIPSVCSARRASAAASIGLASA